MMRGRRAASCFQGCETHNLWTHHFAGSEKKTKKTLIFFFFFVFLLLLFFFIQTQRGTLKEITIMNECGMVIEVERSLKESRGRYNQGL